MSAELGFAGGVVDKLAGVGLALDSRAREPWTPTRVAGQGAARLAPWMRREKLRILEVRPQVASVRAVRDALWSTCRAWHVAELGDCVVACASELVTNAIVHATWPDTADGQLRLAISKSPRELVVKVCDSDPDWPRPRDPVNWEALEWGPGGSAGESGLGLRLVRMRLAELGGEFGCVSRTSGKIVYFALPLSRRGRADVHVQRGGGAR